MNLSLRLLGVGLLALALAGCGSWSKKGSGSGSGSGDGAQTSGLGGSGGGDGRAGSGDPLSQRIIYFEYDSSDVQAQFRSVINAHAQSLRSSGRSVALEGHSDERGSREYNIALGERRAQSVKRLMVAAGLSPSQISTISYGEERPAVQGPEGVSMAKNRRVELRYK
jgi:peptidoglycan-associated lipoprotein